jgi:hypothetical protein
MDHDDMKKKLGIETPAARLASQAKSDIKEEIRFYQKDIELLLRQSELSLDNDVNEQRRKLHDQVDEIREKIKKLRDRLADEK